jgi:hypothetical protein
LALPTDVGPFDDPVFDSVVEPVFVSAPAIDELVAEAPLFGSTDDASDLVGEFRSPQPIANRTTPTDAAVVNDLLRLFRWRRERHCGRRSTVEKDTRRHRRARNHVGIGSSSVGMVFVDRVRRSTNGRAPKTGRFRRILGVKTADMVAGKTASSQSHSTGSGVSGLEVRADART